jgi:hypothetical protein
MIFCVDRLHYDKDIFGNGTIARSCFLSLYDTHFLQLLNVSQKMSAAHTQVLYKYEVCHLNISGFGILEIIMCAMNAV